MNFVLWIAFPCPLHGMCTCMLHAQVHACAVTRMNIRNILTKKAAHVRRQLPKMEANTAAFFQMAASSMNMTCIIGALQTYNITDGGIWRDSYRTSAAHVLSFRRLYMSSWRIWSPDVDKD